ncbi:MAG: hypothetical protein ACPGUD_08605 [Parashewanella sp.]
MATAGTQHYHWVEASSTSHLPTDEASWDLSHKNCGSRSPKAREKSQLHKQLNHGDTYNLQPFSLVVQYSSITSDATLWHLYPIHREFAVNDTHKVVSVFFMNIQEGKFDKVQFNVVKDKQSSAYKFTELNRISQLVSGTRNFFGKSISQRLTLAANSIYPNKGETLADSAKFYDEAKKSINPLVKLKVAATSTTSTEPEDEIDHKQRLAELRQIVATHSQTDESQPIEPFQQISVVKHEGLPDLIATEDENLGAVIFEYSQHTQ